MTLRGTVEKIDCRLNGNLLGLVELLENLILLSEQVRKAMDGDLRDHYLGKNNQKELIHVLVPK